MAENSKIEWTDATWNPVVGCTWASAGCDHCYAATMTRRLEAMGQADYTGLTTNKHFNGVVRVLPHKLDVPLNRRKPTRYFVNSMSDLFHKDVPFEFVDRVFAVMALCPQHTFQVLTKRPDRMAEYFSERSLGDAIATCRDYYFCTNLGTDADSVVARYYSHEDGCRDSAFKFLREREQKLPQAWPLLNVWLGTSVENQAADWRIEHLIKCPAAVRFISAEPLIGPLDLGLRNWQDISGMEIDWVIVGGESGRGARPMHPSWARLIRDDCNEAGVMFFFKQWGAWAPTLVAQECDGWEDVRYGEFHDRSPGSFIDSCLCEEGAEAMYCVGKKSAGRLLDGREWNEYPRAEAKTQAAGEPPVHFETLFDNVDGA